VSRNADEASDQWGEPRELFDVERREVYEDALASRGQRDADQPVIGGLRPGANEPRLFRPVDELARAVVPQQELLRDLADRRRRLVAQALDDHEELVLRGRDALGLRGVVAPPQEPA